MKRSHKSRESRLLERMRQLELRNQALEDGVVALIPTSYLLEFATLYHLAYHGLQRREDTGYTAAAHPSSRPPAHNPEAQRALKLERSELEKRAERIRSTIQQIDPGAQAGAEVLDPGLPMSSQTSSQLAS